MSASSVSRPLLHLGLMLGLNTFPLLSVSAWADEPRRSYSVPASTLEAALTRFAGAAGVNLSVNPALVSGRNSPGLSGPYSVEEGFARLLQGSGLQLMPVGDRDYTLVPQPDTGESAIQIPTTNIDGAALQDGASDEAYAGGQVKRRSNQGMLGNADFMDTPFNITTYTSETAKNQQARTLGDMVANDPSVRTTNPAGGRFEQFSVRGFSLFNSDVSYGGLYGVLPTYSSDMELVDRVDILKGPGALLNGIVPRGSVGGNINIEPKRAGDEPITQVTANYASQNQAGGAVDVARRFGENQRFGVRFNGVTQSGDTDWDDQQVDRTASVLGLDLREERLRLSLDVGFAQRKADAPQERVEIAPGVRMPSASHVDDNFAPDWTYTHTKDTFGALRAEYDLNDSTMVYAAYGARNGEYRFLRSATRILDNNGRFNVTPRYFTRDEDVETATAGVRTWFSTGPVSHTVNLSVNRWDMDFDNAGVRYATSPSNLYDPVDTPKPGTPNRVDTSTHTENRFSSVALADTLGFFDDRLLLTLGGRFQRVEVTNWSNGVRDDIAYDEHATTPAAGVVFKLTPRWSLYANYMEGLSQGETAPSTASNANAIFAPYRTKQAEAGIKYDMGSMAITTSLFRIEQPAYITDAQNNFKPDGELRNQGVEVNLFGEPTRGVRVLGGVMVLDSEQTKTSAGTNDGNHGTGSPILNVNLGGELDIDRVPGLTLTGRFIHTGSQYLDPENQQKIPNWERYDLGARYSFKVDSKPVTVRATVENVLDKRYWASAATSADSAAGLTIGTPRTLLMSATVDF